MAAIHTYEITIYVSDECGNNSDTLIMTVLIENMQVVEQESVSNEFGAELLARVEASDTVVVNITESNELERPTVEINNIN